MMTQGSCACFGRWRDNQLARLVLILPGQDSTFERERAQRHEHFVEAQGTSRGKLASPFDGELGDVCILGFEDYGKVAIAVRSNLLRDCIDLGASSQPNGATYRVPR
jgi:hypothetical protein